MEIVKKVYSLSNELPDNEKYGIRSQMTRAAISIPSNIAEGTSRSSNKDFKRFLEMAMGSAFELETLIYTISYVGLLKSSLINEILLLLNDEQKMINSYIVKLRDSF
jgi:four helix bundle protein